MTLLLQPASFAPFAEVVELVDALRSGRSGRKPVRVRVPPSALSGHALPVLSPFSVPSVVSVLARPLTHPKWWPILCLGKPE